MHMYGRFWFYLDVIEFDLPRNVGRASSCDIIHWERSYGLSTPGQFFACLCFFVGIFLKTVWQHTFESLPQLLITPTPPSQPRASLLAQLQSGGRRQSGTWRRLGWGLLSQWRSERSIRRSGREKLVVWGWSELLPQTNGPHQPLY